MIQQNYLNRYITIVLVATLQLCSTSYIPPNKDSDYLSQYASKMLSYMNNSVHPCNDFYEYACGNWKNVIEEHSSPIKRNNIVDNLFKLEDIVEEILQRSHINDVAPEYAAEFELAKKFYNNCLNADLSHTRASPEYLAVLKEIGGFPAVDPDWNSENFHWLNMSAHLSNYDIKGFVNEDLYTEYPFPPYFRAPHFGFDIQLNANTIENTSSNAYKQNERRMRYILATYGVEEHHINNIITEIFGMLGEILHISNVFNESQCETFSKVMEYSDVVAVEEMWRIYYDIAWQGKDFEDVVQNLTRCHFIYKHINLICQDNKTAAANYLALKFLYKMDSHVSDKKYQRDFCLSKIQSSMKHFFDHLYMMLYFNNGIIEEISDIIKEVRQSLRTSIQNSNWLDESTRKVALLKESSMRERIGRYEEPTFEKLLLGELKKLEFVNGSFEANYLNLCKFRQHMERFNGLNFEKLTKASKPLDVFVGMQANSFYYNMDNTLYVMAGSLMEPIYNKAWPTALKFGTLGYVIGHEFTHGFDTTGSNYDEAGEENYWWSKTSQQGFRKRSECFVYHYSKYLIPEINRTINGELTKDENIADNGGLRESLTAYRRYIKSAKSHKAEEMPGIDLTSEQLFYLGFAQMWCASYKEANYWEELTNGHTIDKYRVLGTLSNNEDFAKAYNCATGTKMNPSDNKCRIW